MAIQQMGLLAYRAPPAGGGGDSALLQAINESSSGIYCSIEFNAFSAGGVGYILCYPSNSQWFWKTGPNPESDYEVIYIEDLFGGTGSVGTEFGDAKNTWYALGTQNAPQFISTLGIGNYSSGWLVIRNKNNPGVELANVTVQLTADPNT